MGVALMLFQRKILGSIQGLIAGGSLLVDYILTVAVSVSAGTDALHLRFQLCMVIMLRLRLYL